MSDQVNGMLLVDKPTGMTSHDVVDRLRRLTGQRRIGHIGTLDPLAEGLLGICLGDATRISRFLVGLDKVYRGTIDLGGMSSTYDAEGDITLVDRPVPETAEEIREAMKGQVGTQIQLPPPYSAVKVNGRKLYDYARAGEAAPQKPRTVRVHRFELLRYDPPQAHFETKVGSGTYVRSMAHDLGLTLGCGGYLSHLRRAAIGAFSVDAAVGLDLLEMEPDLLASRVLRIAEALAHMPKITIQPAAERALLHGRSFRIDDILEFDGILVPGSPVLVLDTAGRALSIAQPVAVSSEEEVDPANLPGGIALGATPLLFKPLRVLVKG
jgi:tRNA pseudouridine55 synthase